MTNIATRIGLGLGAVILVAGIGAGVYATAHDQNTSDARRPFLAQREGPPPGPPGPGGPAGPGGPRAGRGGPRDGMGPLGLGPLGPMMFGRLNLTDAQETEVRTLVEAHRTATKPVLDRVVNARQALHAAVTSSTVDEGAIRARSAELASAEADLAVARARLQADISTILTPEQRTELEQMQSRRAERMQRMGEGRRKQVL